MEQLMKDMENDNDLDLLVSNLMKIFDDKNIDNLVNYTFLCRLLGYPDDYYPFSTLSRYKHIFLKGENNESKRIN